MHFILIILTLFLTFALSHCSKKNEGIVDYSWQEESLKMAGEVCQKISECGKETGAFSGLDKSKATLAENRLQEANCQEYHRKTNVFLLIVPSEETTPDMIKNSARECHTAMTKLSCNDLVNKRYNNIPACEEMGRIQKGLK
ncbi:MAG: hypothetical protein JJT78_01355 [Leptospira sp.]|nr:hypothetical protein [Leptospira sp.]